MADLVIETPEGLSLRRELVGAGSRAAAGLLDLLIVGCAWLALLLATASLMSLDPTGASGFLFGLVVGGGILFVWAYLTLFAVAWQGRTIGKRALGILVVDASGAPASVAQHALRGFFFPLEAALAVPLPLGLVLIAATPRSQRLGDLVAGTLVVRERRALAPSDLQRERDLPRSPQERRLALTSEHARLYSAEDLRFLADLLAREGLDAQARDELYLRSERHFCERLGLDSPRTRTPGQARGLLVELLFFLREARARHSSPVTPPTGSGADAPGSLPGP